MTNATRNTFTAEFGYITDKGRVRPGNEDYVLIRPNLGFAAVADGMGGHNSGELASRLAVETVAKIIQGLSESSLVIAETEPELSQEANHLSFAVNEANRLIYNSARENPENKGMGTTLSALLITRSKITIAHVGDSRVYLLRGNTLRQLTQDHSLVMEQFRQGWITKEEAETSRIQNILTQALGIHRTVKTDIVELEPEPSDKILLCSDGLTKTLKDASIEAALARAATPNAACRTLVDLANEAGGADNITVVVIELRPIGASPAHHSSKIKSFLHRIFKD